MSSKANASLVLEHFRTLHREGHTIIMVTHDQTVGNLADRCVVFEHGRIKETRAG